MIKANDDLRMMCKQNGIPLWELASSLGISDQTLYRKWRFPLDDEERKDTVKVIDRILKDRKA